MNSQEFKSKLIEITSIYLNRADLVQGPGGNTSLKTGKGNMFIKASGYRFDEMTVDIGISSVSIKEIKDFFNLECKQTISESEITMLEVIKENILKQSNGEFYAKPSMETGFHALLDTVVVHTHSVWTNLINCAQDRLQFYEELKSHFSYHFTALPFLTPGFMLSYMIGQDMKLKNQENKPVSDIYFLANHGIIGHGKNGSEVQKILNFADSTIQKYLGIGSNYPSIELTKLDEDHWQPNSEFISELLLEYNVNASFFNQVLFPDQTVFFNNQISDNKANNKKININEGQVIYNCNEKEAKAIHETLTAYLFIYHNLKKLNIKPGFIQTKDIEYINSMDMEKYRKSLM